jgi:hypothetical protein
MDDAGSHNSGRIQRYIEASRAEHVPPRPGPSDFFFVYIKGKLSDYSCTSQDDLLNAINEIFTGVDQEVLPRVFESWVNRLKWAIKYGGKCYTK